MRGKLLLAGALMVAFLAGAMVEGYIKPALSKALTSPGYAAYSYSPVGETAVHRRVVYRETPTFHRHRSWEREVLIVAGSSGAGTAIGALAGGKKGAGIGALSGGIAGLAYDLATRNR